VTKPVTVNGDFNSFTRLPNGTILIGGWSSSRRCRPVPLARSGSDVRGVRDPPRSARCRSGNGTVYAAADNFGDGYAIGTSDDEGTTWQALMSYADVKAINPCLKAQCQMTCDAEVSCRCGRRGVRGGSAAGSTGRAGRRRRGRAGDRRRWGRRQRTGGTPPPPKHRRLRRRGTPGATPRDRVARAAARPGLAALAPRARRARSGGGPTPTSGSD
jgi:hypothetical protein